MLHLTDTAYAMLQSVTLMLVSSLKCLCPIRNVDDQREKNRRRILTHGFMSYDQEDHEDQEKLISENVNS